MGRIPDNVLKLAILTMHIPLLLFSGSAFGEDLRGPAFSDPSIIHVPEEKWSETPIGYSEKHADADLVIDMNQQLYPVLLPIIEDFAQEEQIKVEIFEGTCGKAAGRITRKEVDIGGFCCPPGKLDRLPDLRYHTLGITPLALLAHPLNTVDGITLDQARDIFRGKVTSWSAFGGADRPIKMIASLHCAKRPGHWRLLLDNEDLFSPRFMEVGDMPDQIRLIASAPEAIGYETLWVAARFRDKGAVKGLKLNGMRPAELGHLERGSYPLYRVFNVTSWQGEKLGNPYADKLITLLLQKVKDIDPKYGLIPADRLRQAGWKFKGDELIGEPE